MYQNLEMRSNIGFISKSSFEVARSGDDVAIEIINNSIDSLIELVKGAFLLIDKNNINHLSYYVEVYSLILSLKIMLLLS